MEDRIVGAHGYVERRRKKLWLMAAYLRHTCHAIKMSWLVFFTPGTHLY